MYEIKCPKCGEVFQVEKAAYAEIVDQVRNEQFSADLEARLKSERETMAARQAAALADAEKRFGEQAAQKDREIFRLQEQAKTAGREKELAVSEAVQKKEREIGELRLEMEQEKGRAEARARETEESFRRELADRDAEIDRLRDFMYENVYFNPVAKREDEKARGVVEALYTYYLDHVELLPEEFLLHLDEDGEQRITADFIACMTDTYAISEYQRLFVPAAWN